MEQYDGALPMPDDLRFATVADTDHPLHGAIIEVVRPLPALRSALAAAVQCGNAQVLLPVHMSDLLDYVWPKLTSVGPGEWPTSAAVNAGTADGLAPPHVMFTALAPLVDAVPTIRKFLAEHPQAPHTTLLVHIGANGVGIRTVTAVELRRRAERVREAVECHGAPQLQLTIDMTTQSAYFGSTHDALPQQLAANRWLALRTLLARLEGDAVPLRSTCGTPSAYAFVEHEVGCLVQGAAFVVPLAREEGVRVGCEALVTGLVGRPDLNGKSVTVLRSSGLGGRDDGWRDVAESPKVQVDRWPARLPDGECVRLRPANLVALDLPL